MFDILLNSPVSNLLLIFLRNPFGYFPSILNTFFSLLVFLLSLTSSAMNMDRFEKGPREILNPDIQKVRVKPEHQPAHNEM